MTPSRILIPALGILFVVFAAAAQESATPGIAVLDVPRVWRNWDEYVEIIRYVEQIKKLDQRDLEGMRDEALAMAKEADERFRSGELLERDYRIQKAAIGARLRKLQSYWEIREEIIEKRLKEDEQRRLREMQEAVDDLGLTQLPFILKGRAAAYYDPALELAPLISETLNQLDRSDTAEVIEETAAGDGISLGPDESGSEPAAAAEDTAATGTAEPAGAAPASATAAENLQSATNE